MNFKKKAIIGIAAGLFAVATVFNMQMNNTDVKQDIQKENIMAIANAGGEVTIGPICEHVPPTICDWDYDDSYLQIGRFLAY